MDVDPLEAAVEGVLKKHNSNADGWVNALAGLGGRQDKSKATQFSPGAIIDDGTLEGIYAGDGMGARIIDAPVEDMVREWIDLDPDQEDTEEDEADLEAVEDELERLGTQAAFADAMKWARLYGGAMIVIGAQDGQDMNQPLNERRITGIDSLRILTRPEIWLTNSVFQTDPKQPGFGDVIGYYCNFTVGTSQVPVVVHASRCLLFKGRGIPPNSTIGMSIDQRYWGLSELQHVHQSLADWNGIMGSVSNIMYEIIVGKYKLQNLAQMLSSGNENAVRTRMEIINMSKSIINAVLLGENEDYSRDSVSLSGVGEIIDRFMMKLSGVTGIPVTRLFGRSPAGMNATGESDTATYYDMIKSRQGTVMKPPLKRLVDLISIYTKTTTPIKIEFNPLFQLTEKEKADTDLVKEQAANTRATMYATYITNGVLTGDDVFSLEWAEMGLDGPQPAPEGDTLPPIPPATGNVGSAAPGAPGAPAAGAAAGTLATGTAGE